MRERVILAGVAYFLLVFVAGFALGVARELFVRPYLGPDRSRIAELPLMLAISWYAAGLVVRRFGRLSTGLMPFRAGVPLPAEWWAVGLLAFALLMLAEFLAGWLVLKVGLFAFLGTFFTWVGLIGLLAQMSLIIFPALQADRRLPAMPARGVRPP